MLKIFTEPARPALPPVPHPVLALGFRPFFLVAGVTAVLAMLLWLHMWERGSPLGNGYGLVDWHAHEMLFGYATAVVAGFLLTAVRNWTGVNTPTGLPLAGLASLWLAGRLLPWLAEWLPAVLIAGVDLAFLPLLAHSLKGPLWQSPQRANRVFVPILWLMAGANVLFHLQHLGLASSGARGLDAMLLLLVLLIGLIGGRVIPFFAQSALPGFRARRFQAAEQASLWVIGALAAALAASPAAWLVAPLATIAGLSQALRLIGWHDRRVWGHPILWVLYTGFGWLVLGLLLLALAAAGHTSPSAARHALTVGGIGVTTLGMMARVALGHTGRPIEPTRSVTWSFIALNLAAAVRVLGPLLAPEHYPSWTMAAGILWAAAFATFVYHYLPVLLAPRPDGQPG
jgi:uncharacterized protein involved in response to NO